MGERAKKCGIAALAVGLTMTLAIGGTLAYMTRETEKRVNNFTFPTGADGLNAMLTEPAWDGVIDYEYAADGSSVAVIYDYIEQDGGKVPVYGYTDGDKDRPITDVADIANAKRPIKDATDQDIIYGVDQAKNMIPGQTAAKNPAITNTSTLLDEWVAAKVTFIYRSGTNKGKPLNATDIANVFDVVEIDWNVGTGPTDWERQGDMTTSASASQTFYYQSLLTKANDGAGPGEYGGSTTPIFNSIKVKDTATTEGLKKLSDMGGFAIYVEGFAAQKDVGANYTAFKTWGLGDDGIFGGGDDNVVFTNTPSETTPAANVDEPGIIAAPAIA